MEGGLRVSERQKRQEILCCIVLPLRDNAAGILSTQPRFVNRAREARSACIEPAAVLSSCPALGLADKWRESEGQRRESSHELENETLTSWTSGMEPENQQGTGKKYRCHCFNNNYNKVSVLDFRNITCKEKLSASLLNV